MKILKEEKIPLKWWIGRVYNCLSCHSLLEMEEESDASPAAVDFSGNISLITFKCPVCGEENFVKFTIDE